MPKVLNKRTDVIPPDAVYVGRPSKWGNPFKMHCEGERDLVCDQFDMHLGMNQIDCSELRGKDLVCWCAPLRCHADSLLRRANGQFVPPKVE